MVKLKDILGGIVEIPDNMVLGNPCTRNDNHNINSVTLRYKAALSCVRCSRLYRNTLSPIECKKKNKPSTASEFNINNKNKSLFKTRSIEEWINGPEGLPDNMYIGLICKHNHGVKGKSIRYRSGACVECLSLNNKYEGRKAKGKRYRDLSALDRLEELKQDKDDYDPLL